MLTSETKQKIQNLRDTLVGKIPVPTEQVKQITLGFIYKFMSDIDQENKELGSKSFFRGDYEKYSWHKIMDRRLSSYDRVLLYSEGLEKMALNPNIPQLFRDIFKGAFLPFRDPAIVNEFVKGINEFKYEHSEDLGDAFEFLLMVMDAQGDAGQFRTPRHIIDFIVQAVDPQKTDKILDPACGTAGFLVGAYKHILKQNTAPNSNRPGSALTTTQRNNLSKNFVGYDISHDMVRLSLVNMYLHQFSDPKIYEYDTLTSLDRWEDNFDCILANPPFMTPRGGIRPHNRFAIRANRSEVLFVDYIAEHLNPSGKAGIIVPEGIIFQSSNAYKSLRKMLVENNYLYAVVSLPAGVFQPYSGVKTSILLIDKTLAKRTKDTLLIKIESDGFDLGAQRRSVEQNDLPKALEIITKYKQALIEEKKCSFIDKYQDSVQIVTKKEIAEGGDYYLSWDRYKETKTTSHKSWPMVLLGDVCNFEGGSQPPKLEFIYKPKDGYIKFVQIRDFGEKGVDTYIPVSPKNNLCDFDDVLIARYGASLGRICTGLYGAYNVALLKSSPNTAKLLKRYLFYLFNSEFIQKKIQQLGARAAQAGVRPDDLKIIKIPLPLLEVQQEIVTELDGYQKIIAGAKQVVENYSPQIKIDSKWERVALEDVCDIKSGGTPSTNNKKYWENGNIPWVGSTVCKNTFVNESKGFITEAGLKNSSAKKFKPKTTLIALVGATIGKTGFLTFESTTNQNIAGLYPLDLQKLIPEYLFYVSQSLYPEFMKLGSGKFRMANLGFVKKLKIPLLPLETQKQIVAQIEEEQKLVEANKKLIEVFEQKIKNKIKEVWGE